MKGCPLLRMRRGAGCLQLKRRLPPVANGHRPRSLQSAPPSMLLSCEVANPYIFYAAYSPSTIRSAPGAFLISSRPACWSFLIWVGKASSLSWGQFLKLVQKAILTRYEALSYSWDLTLSCRPCLCRTLQFGHPPSYNTMNSTVPTALPQQHGGCFVREMLYPSYNTGRHRIRKRALRKAGWD